MKRINVYLFFLICMNLSQQASGQFTYYQEKYYDNQEIVFDSSGKMISFPSIYVSRHTNFSFRVTVPSGLVQRQIAEFNTALKKTLDAITGDEKIKKINPCLLGPGYAFFVDSLPVLIKILADSSICDTQSLQRTLDRIDAISLEVDSSKKQFLYIADFLPVKQFLGNIFNNQYSLIVTNGKVCEKEVHLIADLSVCNKNCFNFTGSFGEIDTALCAACGIPNITQAGFKLIRQDPLNKAVVDWYNYQQVKLDLDKKKVDPLKVKIKAFVKNVNAVALYDSKDAALVRLTDWLTSWLWFTNGVVVFDPFVHVPRENYLAQIKAKQIQIDSAKGIVIFLDSVKVHVEKNVSEMAEFAEVIKKQNAAKDFIDQTSKAQAELQDILAKDFIEVLKTREFQYEGIVKLSGNIGRHIKRNINPMKQFDAAMGYREIPLNHFYHQKVSEVPENEKLFFLIHNIPAGSTAKIWDSPLPYNDQEEFTTLVDEQLKKINFGTLSDANIKLLQEFFTSGFQDKATDKVKFLSGADDGTCADARAYLDSMVTLVNNEKILFPPKPGYFNKTSFTKPFFSTYMQQANVDDAPYKDTIIIKQYVGKDSAIVMKSSIRVGKLRYIQIASGIAFSQNPVYNTTIDTAGGGFSVNSRDNRARAIVGFKVFPFKNYNRDNSFIPRYFFRRLSVFGGFEILKPLDNFYVGGAYDILPGLALSVGSNYYLQTNYKIRNNAITDTYRTYKNSGAYYAVMVNPIIFVQFVKLFFK